MKIKEFLDKVEKDPALQVSIYNALKAGWETGHFVEDSEGNKFRFEYVEEERDNSEWIYLFKVNGILFSTSTAYSSWDDAYLDRIDVKYNTSAVKEITVPAFGGLSESELEAEM